MRAGRRVVLVCAVAVAGLGGSGWAAGLCSQPVATVGSRPITAALYRHWHDIARRGSPRASERYVRRQTMSFLIQYAWIEGEARERGIRIGARQVDAAFDRQRRETFRTDAEFQRFLRSTGQTIADVKYRVRLDMLNSRLQRAGVSLDFTTKWRARTRCLPAYVVRECGGTL